MGDCPRTSASVFVGRCMVCAGGGWSAARGNVPGGGDFGPAVTLVQRGGIATLANGIVTVEINTANASVKGIDYHGRQMVSQDGRHRSIYFSRDGGQEYEVPDHCFYSVTTQTPDTVDISCKHVFAPAEDKHAWDADVHYVLRRGASGLYIYVICSHKPAYPCSRFRSGGWSGQRRKSEEFSGVHLCR